MTLPKIIVIDNLDETWTVFESFTWQGLFSTITVPEGMITDFASIPRMFWSIVPPFGRHSLAALVHDSLYRTEGLEHQLSRYQCDLEFEYAMRCGNVNPIKRAIMFRAVRMFADARWEQIGG
jgi:hypothetical protein